MTRTQRSSVVALAVAAIVIAANASEGAYFSQSWGWVALAFLVPTTVLLILDRVAVPGLARTAFASLVGALGVWIALSAVWSLSTSASIREAERVLVYVAVALAVALVLRRGDGTGVLAGALTGVTAISAYGLATRLFPDRFDAFDDPINTYRLAEPLGYWNAQGLLATIGLVVAAGFVAHSRRTRSAVAVAAAGPVLALTLYFTFSRGAWAALVFGLGAATVADPRRLRFIWTAGVTAIPAAICVVYASGRDALTTEDAAAAAAARDGHRVAVVLSFAVIGSVLAALAAREVARRVPASRSTRLVFNVALAGSAVVLAVVALSVVGGFSELRERFRAEPVVGVPVAGVDLNDRLFSVSGNGRSQQLRVAWRAGRERPFLGQGSGTFEYLWYKRRRYQPIPLIVRDGHSLYLESFAEIGAVGLGLLGGALLAVVLAGVRARRQRFVTTALGAFIAWAAASAFDWHWEMVGLTMTALLAGSAALLGSERRRRGALQAGSRLALIGVTGTLSIIAVWSLVGNQALFAGREAVAGKEWREAREHARRSKALLPWSHEPEVVLGDAAAGLGSREQALRAYRHAVDKDPRNWVAWLRLAQVARGAERSAAYDRVRELNPHQSGLPDE